MQTEIYISFISGKNNKSDFFNAFSCYERKDSFALRRVIR